MPEYTPPRIESTYFVPTDEAILGSLRDAAVEYDQTRPIAEGFVYEQEQVDMNKTYVHFGRSVLQASAYAEVGHELDRMQTEIEAYIPNEADREKVIKGRAGLHLYGLLPD